MNPCQVAAGLTPEFLFKLTAELVAFFIGPLLPVLIAGIGPTQSHPQCHDCSGQRAADRPLSPDTRTEPCSQPWDQGIVDSKVLLETQGD